MARKKIKPLQTETCCVCAEDGEVGSEVIPVLLIDLFKKTSKAWVHHGECHKLLRVNEREKNVQAS